MRPVEFFAAMLDELEKNDYKGGWYHEPSSVLLSRLREEVAELKSAIISGRPSMDILSEAADVANFAYMIADNATRDKV